MLKITRARTTDDLTVTFAMPSDIGPTSVVGDFNGWDPLAHPMRKRSNGTRSVAVRFTPGEALRFRYLTEGGRWSFEPEADVAGQDNVIVLPD